MRVIKDSDASELKRLERVIERGLKTFVEVAAALKQIKDQQLYLVSHRSFEDYCKQRWSFGRHYVNRLIEAGKVLDVKIHPAAEIFPMMAGSEFRELVEDIRKNGQRVPITYWGGQLLDGRNRYRACVELGIDPEEEELDEELVPDPVSWVLSTNLHRRHLTTSQRAMIAGKIAKLTPGAPKGNGNASKSAAKTNGQKCPVDSSNNRAAEQLKVGERTVKQAKSVIRGGCQELIAAVDAGDVTVCQAEKLVKAVPDKAKQAKAVRSRDIPGAVNASTACPQKAPAGPSGREGAGAKGSCDEAAIAAARKAENKLVVIQALLDMCQPCELEHVARIIADRMNPHSASTATSPAEASG